MDKSFAKTFGVKGQINSEREAQETGINHLISGYNGLSHRKKYLSFILKVNAPDLPEVLAILKLCPRCSLYLIIHRHCIGCHVVCWLTLTLPCLEGKFDWWH